MRELLFYTVLVIGCLALLRLYWPARSRSVRPSAPPTLRTNLVQQLLEGETLSPDERRMWLDTLLAQQQEDEQK